ncbi:PilN domain-containing protein [Pseudidiomarina terrestris]|uniref:PilN domain-containing protein n=1 Tax=Pseudidiomarina terrestris TaxID=2820060 RepID=A0AAW7R0I0_9GAMM|nr:MULTISPECIES: PilN domain-containing protein [unclassified Pseudidiomarina]MDN7124793.1 PilN domain-containing protein [Pseudidiomarina sp. 1APP75-32.1]MDN7125850.1 PilN domain-containing protein [Pseudidiomarina sp. 1APR75-33.1]MDN7129733.1 PilN domain-containing protein [Pseudidiomarina sp. 1APR75-15]MDN7136482.1 PilN domain-containing protein [Pseudidiomarina sp. 1ASP75-5]MDN7138009.1 PilN domain-containing protein [Pseudidiomarina sp. 1ASP75-14]
MAHVNLLPWREIARQRAKQRFGIHAFIALLIAAALVFIAYKVIQDFQQQQIERNQFLTSQITILDAQIAEIQEINKKKDQIVNRMELIQSLHQDRNTAIHMLNELSKRTPDGVHIVSVEKRGDRMSLRGRSVSNNRVSEFLRAITESSVFNNPELREISSDVEETEGPTRYSAFSLSVTVARPQTIAPGTTEGGS